MIVMPTAPINYLILPQTFPSVTTRVMTKTAEKVTLAARGRRGMVSTQVGRPPPRILLSRRPHTDQRRRRKDLNLRRHFPFPLSSPLYNHNHRRQGSPRRSMRRLGGSIGRRKRRPRRFGRPEHLWIASSPSLPPTRMMRVVVWSTEKTKGT